MIKNLLTVMLLLHIAFFSIASATSVGWDESDEKWYKQESEHFTVSYLSEHKTFAERVLRIAETVQQELFPFYQKKPKNKVRIILLDDTDIALKVATTLEYGEIRLSMSPSTDVVQIESEDDWIHLSLSNQYSQILHFQLANGSIRGAVLSAEFTPYMFINGVALYLQNKNNLKSNLLYASTTEMKMRMEVKDDELRELNTVVVQTRDWPYDAMYLYGIYFIDYLAQTYGEDKLLDFLTNYSQNLLSYILLNHQAEVYFGQDLYAIWDDFKIYLQQKYTPQIERLSQQEVNGEVIAHSPFLATTSAGKGGLIMGVQNGEDRHSIQQYINNQWHSITATNKVKSFDNHRDEGLLITRTITYVNKHTFNDIYIFNDDKWRHLTHNKRFKYVQWLDDGQHFVASRIVNGISELWLFNQATPQEAVMIWQGETDDIIGNFDISPDGNSLVAAIKRPFNNWRLEHFSFEQGKWSKLTERAGIESSPSFTPEGDILYSANYDRIYNIYKFSPQNGTIKKLTNVLSGAFRPLWQKDLGLVYQTYESDGYAVRHILEPTTIKDIENIGFRAKSGEHTAYSTDIPLSPQKPYSTWRTMQSHSLYPLLFVDEVRTLVGINTYGSDALGRHNYNLYALWDASNDQGSYVAEYKYDNRWTFSYSQDYNFNNLTPEASTPLYQISKSQVFLLQRNNIVNAIEDQLGFHGGLTYSLDDLVNDPEVSPLFLNTLFTEQDTHELQLGLALTFDNREEYHNVHGTGWGHYFDLTYEQNLLTSDFSGQKYQTQWHFTFDLPRRFTLLTRLAAGYATDTAKPFALGGNNLSEEMRLFDRNQQSIRGYDDLAQRGNIYTTQRVELNAFLGRFEQNFGLFPLGMGDIAGKVYVDSGAAWDSGDSPEPLIGAGAQVQLEFKLGYNYTLPITFGYAYGFDDIKGKDYLYMNFGSTY